MSTDDFTEVTSIAFEKRRSGSRQRKKWFTVRNPRDLQSLLSAIRVVPFADGRPGCIHEMFATFHKPSGTFDIDFCPVCFGDNCMPPEFFSAFEKLARKHTRRVVAACCALLAISAAIAWAFLR